MIGQMIVIQKCPAKLNRRICQTVYTGQPLSPTLRNNLNGLPQPWLAKPLGKPSLITDQSILLAAIALFRPWLYSGLCYQEDYLSY